MSDLKHDVNAEQIKLPNHSGRNYKFTKDL